MSTDCRSRSQVAGGVIGLLLLMGMVTIGGMSLLASLLLAILAGLVITGLLVWGVCEGRGGAEEYAGLLAADWKAEPFVPTRRVVRPGGDVSEEGPLNPVGPVPPGPALERVTMARGDEPVRIGADVQGTRGSPAAPAEGTGTAATRDDATPPPAQPPSKGASTATPSVEPGLPEADVLLSEVAVTDDAQAELDSMEQVPQHPPQSTTADLALHASGAASPSADAEAGAEEDPAGGIVPLERRESEGGVDAGGEHGRADDLTRIHGVGPIAGDWLIDNGVTRFSQIAGWSDADVTRYAVMMGPAGHRIRSDDWVGQARRLAAGAGDGTP